MMIEPVVRYHDARQPILAELNNCWETIRVAQHLIGYMRRMGYAPGGRFARTKQYQLLRLTVAIIHADRAEQSLAAIPKPYVLEWRGGVA